MQGSGTAQVLGFQLRGSHCGGAGHLCPPESGAEAPRTPPSLGCRDCRVTYPRLSGRQQVVHVPHHQELGPVWANAPGSGSRAQFHIRRVQQLMKQFNRSKANTSHL